MPFVINVPPVVVRNAEQAWGADGRAWLARLPELLEQASQAWGLRLGAPYELSYHWVARAWLPDGSPAVLKLGPPGAAHLRREAATLAAFGGHGAARLLEHAPDLGALLLQRARPGQLARVLVPGQDEAATAAIAATLAQLHQAPVPTDAAVPPLHTERQAFVEHLAEYPGDDPLPRELVELALRLFDRLCHTATRQVVLHGDLHHDNLVRHRGGWLAIDPHGWIGDPGFDAGPLLYNPDPEREDATLLARVPHRVAQLAAELELPHDRVLGWGFVAAMLSEVWNAQDAGQTGTRALAVARLLATDAEQLD